MMIQEIKKLATGISVSLVILYISILIYWNGYEFFGVLFYAESVWIIGFFIVHIRDLSLLKTSKENIPKYLLC